MSDGALHEYKEKPGSCADCGNSPVNHFGTYCSQTFSVWSSNRERDAGLLHTVSRWGDVLFDRVEPYIYISAAALPFARFAHDPSRAATYRSQVVWEEARRRGIPMEQLTLFGAHTEVYRAHINDEWFYFNSLPIPPRLARDIHKSVDDKYELKRVLQQAGIPTPRVASATTLQDAKAALREFGVPVAVKPQVGSRARHTTVRVGEDDIASAFAAAQQLCRYVAVEEYMEGSVCRGTVVGGKLAGFFQGEAPRVMGDGISTIRSLVEQRNAHKPERVQDIVLTPEHERFLSRLGYSPDSVLPLGVATALTHRTGRLFGGRTRELLGSEHPALRAYLERAAAAVRAPVVGFDLIIKDPEADPDAQKWGIIEANSLPYIDLHYLPLEGTPSPVASAVWDLWDADI